MRKRQMREKNKRKRSRKEETHVESKDATEDVKGWKEMKKNREQPLRQGKENYATSKTSEREKDKRI